MYVDMTLKLSAFHRIRRGGHFLAGFGTIKHEVQPAIFADLLVLLKCGTGRHQFALELCVLALTFFFNTYVCIEETYCLQDPEHRMERKSQNTEFKSELVAAGATFLVWD